MSKPVRIRSLNQFYQKRFPSNYPWRPLKIDSECRVLIVVPAYDEKPDFLLNSLEACKLEKPTQFGLLWLVNQADGDPLFKRHEAQALALQNRELSNGMPLYSHAQLHLNPRHAGVGLARKIGMDMALDAFAQIDFDGLIVGLDGDCKVSANYLEGLLKLEKSPIKAASLHFEHPLEGLEETNTRAIINYELWLRYYSQALEWSGFKYYHHTIGSSMAVRASTYARVGGMNRRKAGEDFYFLHKLMPLGNYHSYGDIVVYPQARYSDRVPFGTGRAMQDIKSQVKNYDLVYSPLIFIYLKRVLSSSRLGIKSLQELTLWSQFLIENPKIQHSFRALCERVDPHSFSSQFEIWLDGFKVLKFVHHLQAHYEDRPLSVAVSELLGLKGEGLELLKSMREHDQKR